LQEALRKKYPEVSFEVINAGIPGFRSSDSLKNFQHRVLPLEPDLVIYYEANNDMAYDTNVLANQRGVIQTDGRQASPVVCFLSAPTLRFDLVYKTAPITFAQKDSTAGRLNGLPRDLPKNFIANLDQMHQELKRRDIPFVMSTFIVKYRRDQARSE